MAQLVGGGARFVIWAYFVTMAVLAIWTLDSVRSPWPTLLAVAIFGAVCVAVTRDTSDRLSPAVTVLVLVAGPVMTLLVSWQTLHGGYTQWYFGAATVGLFYLALRGRIAVAWIGFVVLSACIMTWGLSTSHLEESIVLVARQFPILAVGTLFAAGLRRTSESILRVSAATSEAAIAEAAALATAKERNERLRQLDEFATPLLEKLASGAPITAEDRVEFAVAEADVRDSVRARGLRLPEIIEAARSARRRGVEVVLLDDRGGVPLNHDTRLELGLAVSTALVRIQDGRLTARLLPPGRTVIATIVMDGTTHERIDVIAP
jgi:hypothetical protein